MPKKKLPLPPLDVLHDYNLLLANADAYRAYLQQGRENVPLKEYMQVTVRLAIFGNMTNVINDVSELVSTCEEYILAHGADEEKGGLYRIYASQAFSTGKHMEGLSLSIKALELFRHYKLDFRPMDANILCGTFCMLLSMEEEGMMYFKEAYMLASQLPDKKKNVSYRSSLADNYLRSLPLDEALKLNNEILADARTAFTNNYALEAGAIMRFANIYMNAGKFREAAKYADEGLLIMEQYPDMTNSAMYIMNFYIVKANAAADRNEEKELLHYTSLLYAKGKDILPAESLADGHFILLRFYINKRNAEKAKHYLDLIEAVVPVSKRGKFNSDLLDVQNMYYTLTADTGALLGVQEEQQNYKLRIEQEKLTNRVHYVTTLHELEMKKTELVQQKAALELRTQELNMTNYHLQLRNQLLTELKENIDDLKKAKSKADAIFTSISNKIEHAFAKEELEKEQFRTKFDETYRLFIASLHQLYPALSVTECRICALLRSGFNTKEIANLLSTAPRNVENHRLSIRKKMNLSREDNLNLILTEIN